MKKILLSMALALSCQWAMAQQAQSLFNDYKTQKHVEYVSVPKVMLGIAAAKVKNGDVQALLQQVRSVKVLRLDDCRKGVRKKFAKKLTQLPDKGYEEYTRMKRGRDNLLVLVKQTDSHISEIVVLNNDRDNCMAALVTGHINREDVEAVVGMTDL